MREARGAVGGGHVRAASRRRRCGPSDEGGEAAARGRFARRRELGAIARDAELGERGQRALGERSQRRRQTQRARLGRRRLGEPRVPRVLERREHAEGAARAGAQLAALEHHAVLRGEHLHAGARERALDGAVAARGVRRGVAVPAHERGAALARSARHHRTRVAAAHHEAVTAAREVGGEPLETAVQEAHARCAHARAREERVVEHEQEAELARARGGRGERGVVGEPQVGPEPVEGAHGASVAAGAPAASDPGRVGSAEIASAAESTEVPALVTPLLVTAEFRCSGRR